MSDDGSNTDTGNDTTNKDAANHVGVNGPTDIPEETVASESDLALNDLDARREPGKKQGNQ